MMQMATNTCLLVIGLLQHLVAIVFFRQPGIAFWKVAVFSPLWNTKKNFTAPAMALAVSGYLHVATAAISQGLS